MKRLLDRPPKRLLRGMLFALIIFACVLASLPAASVDAQAATNIALNKPVTASTSQSGLTPAGAVDGNTGTRWGSEWADPQWIRIDLGATYTINRVVLRWEGAYGRSYQIQTSATGTTWTTIYSTTTGDGGVDDLTGLAGSGRYIRMNGTVRGTGWGYSLWEFEVYSSSATPTATNTLTRTPTVTATRTPTRTPTATVGTPAGCGTTNVALNKTASSSSNETAAMTPNLAVDGNAGTRWSSAYTDPQWLMIDLGSTMSICRVRLNWEGAFARSYQIQVSATGTSGWTNIYSTTTGDGGIDDLTNLSGSGRYIRMNGTVRATGYGYSLWEMEVFSGSSSVTNTPTATNTVTRTPSITPTGGTGTVPVQIRIPHVEYLEIGLSPADVNGVSLIKTQNTSQNVMVTYNSGTTVTLSVVYMVSGTGQTARFQTVLPTGTISGNPLSVTVGANQPPIDVILINPTPNPNSGNLALNKPVTASTIENAGTPASAAVDANTGTRWSSAAADPQWIYVDLGSTQSIGRVRLNWEAAFGRSYQIQTSNDATNWTNIYTTTTGDGGMDDLTGLTGSGRYLRMNGTVRGTIYGYSLWEFEVYAPGGGPTQTPTPVTPVATFTPTPTIPAAFSLTAPANASMITNTRRPTLTWNAVAGTVRYEVWMNITRTDYDWTAPGPLLERYTKLGETTSTSYTLTSDLPDRWTYKWYVIAVDGGNVQRRSNSLQFSVYMPTLETVADGINIVNGARDMNKNGNIEPYEDWRLPVETRVNDLMSRMTMTEKAYQMFYNAQAYPLSGWHFGPSLPRDLYNDQLETAGTRLGIPFVSTGDTIHGYQTSYPTQIALAASRNYQNAYLVTDMQRREQLPVGYRGTLGPLAEVDTKVLYPRFQEGNGENAEVAAAIMRAMTAGFQAGPELNPQSVLVTTKHWPGEGAGGEAGITFDGISIHYHMIPWRASFEAGAGGVMPGYAGSSHLDPGGPGAGDSKPILDYLRINMNYDGLITTDWLPSGSWVRAANAGSDVMGGADPGAVGFTMDGFIAGVPQSRIDEAVRRILRVKFKLGIFENPYGDPVGGPSAFHTPANMEIATEASRDSMTLLKNTGILPLRFNPGDAILVTGARATDGPSCCIWTSYFHQDYGPLNMWQAIQQRAQQAGLNAYLDTSPVTPRAAIVVTGEPSYTHGTSWPKEQPYLTADQLSLIQNLKAQGIPVVVVYTMPRPYVITTESNLVDAIVIAYRSGEGGGPAVAQLLFGDYEPSGRLPFQLPRDMSQIGTDVESNQLERWDLPYDLGATEAERTAIRNQIAAGGPVTTTYGNPLYPYGFGIQGFGLTDTSNPAAFNLAAPANGATVSNSLPTLTWQASSDPQTGMKRYEVWVDNVKVADVVGSTSYVLTKKLTSGSHSWYVNAVNWANGVTRSTSVFTFNFTDTAAPNMFDLLVPANGSQPVGGTQTLAWEASYDPGSGLDHYEVFIDGVNVQNIPSAGMLATTTNIALNKPAAASSTQTGAFGPANAFDGNPATRWESAYSDPQWLQVDLGVPMEVTRVRLLWEAAYATSFRIEVSVDGTSWTSIYTTAAGTGGTSDITGLRGYGRYVRMYGLTRATGYGYSLFEFEVYGLPTFSYTRTGLALGAHTWYVVAVDAFGNRRQSTSTYGFTVR